MQRHGIPALAGRSLTLPRLSAADRAAFGVAWRALWISRLVAWLGGVGAVAVWGLAARGAQFDPGGVTAPFGAAGDALVAPGARWDAVWYLAIANDGYGHEAQRGAFFPLYPALVKAAGAVVGSPVVAGMLVSTAAFLVALVLLHRLTALELGEEAARGAVWCLACFPMAFFLSAVYSEALFLALSIGAVYAARTGRWAWAGALAALGAGTRSAGILLVVPLVLLHVRAHGWRPAPSLAWIGLAPLGLAAFSAVLALAGDDPLTPLHAQDLWLREFAGPFAGAWDGVVAAWDGVRQLASGSHTRRYLSVAAGDPMAVARQNLMLLGFLALAVPAVVGVARRLPLAYAAYCVTALALPLSYPVAPQPLMSLPRFLLVLFPLFMWLGWWTTRPARPQRRMAVVVGAELIGLAVFTAQFATWHFVA